jgi:hypothetical protein
VEENLKIPLLLCCGNTYFIYLLFQFQDYHLTILEVAATVLLAEIQLNLGKCKKARGLVLKVYPLIVQHSSVITQGNAHLLLAKSLLGASAKRLREQPEVARQVRLTRHSSPIRSSALLCLLFLPFFLSFLPSFLSGCVALGTSLHQPREGRRCRKTC